ncbi:MAG: CHAP domain-containing protein [Burkholderiaceae bacterium]|nr:CHAP domain-containing protein [Burkholderiaceae bacterium]
MGFVPRLTRPTAGNKYYIRKANGGYSNAIAGKPTDKDCNVLSNCVGYAYGRFNEIGGYGYCKYLAPVNAENFIQYKGSCTVGQTPKLGACMVWQKGNTLSASDGAGHVAIVEKVISDTEVVTSESGWGDKRVFWTQTRKKGSNGNWGAGSNYKFLGFIYNPAVKDEPKKPAVTPTVKRDTRKNQIQVKVTNLRVRTGAGTKYSSIGYAKEGYYNYTETKVANGYTWYKIATNQWIASSKNWTTVYKVVKTSVKVDVAYKKATSLTGKYKVNVKSGTNLRTGAGTNKPSLGVLKTGAIVHNYGYYNVDKTNTKWLYVKTSAGAIGYCSIKDLKKC